MGSEVKFSEDRDPDDIVIMPTGRLDRDEIRKIPSNAHMVQINIEEDGVMFTGGRFNPESKQAWIDGLDDEEEAYENTTVFYVRPEKLKDPDVPLVDVPTPGGIADSIIESHDVDGDRLSTSEVRELLIEAVEQGRKGLVQNPF